MALTESNVLRAVRTLVDKFEESSTPTSLCSLAGALSSVLCVVVPLLTVGGLLLLSGQAMVHLTSPIDVRYQWEEIPLANSTSESTPAWEPCISSAVHLPVRGPSTFEVAHSFGLTRRFLVVAYTTGYIRSLEYVVFPAESDGAALGSGSLSNTKGASKYEILKTKQPWVPTGTQCVPEGSALCSCLGKEVEPFGASRSTLLSGELGQGGTEVRIQVSGKIDSTDSEGAAQLFVAAYSETILGSGTVALGNFLSIFGAVFVVLSLCLTCPTACLFVYGSHPPTAAVLASAARGNAGRFYEMISTGLEEERSDDDAAG